MPIWSGHDDLLALWQVQADGSLVLGASVTYDTRSRPTVDEPPTASPTSAATACTSAGVTSGGTTPSGLPTSTCTPGRTAPPSGGAAPGSAESRC